MEGGVVFLPTRSNSALLADHHLHWFTDIVHTEKRLESVYFRILSGLLFLLLRMALAVNTTAQPPCKPMLVPVIYSNHGWKTPERA